MTKIGALEAGGTKMVLAVYDGDGQELERLTIPTEAPEITMPRMTGFFRDHAIDALGVGSFGPLDLNPASPTYGNITSTPKLKWRNYPLLKGLLNGRDIPAAIDTDVNAAVIAEVECGAARGCESAVYMWEAAPCMACCTPRWGTCCSGLIPTIPTRAAYAPITTDVWRGWPRVRPSARASAATRATCPTTIPPSGWRRIIWRRCVSI